MSKLAGEIYVQQFHKTYGISTTSLRFFNVYGHRQRKNMYSGVITNFASRLLRGQPPIINGNGRQTRDFVHVSDIVSACLLAAAGKTSGEVFNVGTGRAVSVLELAKLMSRIIVGHNVAPMFHASRKGEIVHSCANISKIQSELGFKPIVYLKAGMRDFSQD